MKMRSLGHSLTQYNWCPSKGAMPCDKRLTQIECHVMNEAVTRVIQLQAKEYKSSMAIAKG